MKLNTELIQYYLASGELREQLDWIWEKQGLYRKPTADELEMLSLAEKPPSLNFDGLNQRILDEMPAWEASLQPLLAFSGLTAETMAQLQGNEKWQVFENLQALFVQQSQLSEELFRALLFTGHLDFVFENLGQLPPVERWKLLGGLFDAGPANLENRSGLILIRNYIWLQRSLLLAWEKIREEHLLPVWLQPQPTSAVRQMALLMLLMEFSEPKLQVEIPSSPVYYCFPDEDLELVFAFFLLLFPRRYQQFYWNEDSPSGKEPFKHRLREHLAWIPMPHWIQYFNTHSQTIWAIEKPWRTVPKKKLALETDWFSIAGKYSPKEFFTEAKGFGICERQYQAGTEPCSEGRLAVCAGKQKWGFVDRHGKWVLPPEYKYTQSFSEGWAVVMRKTGEPFFIDLQGEIKIEFPKDYLVSSFSDGLALVWEDPSSCQFHFMDKSLKYVVSDTPMQFDGFHEEKARFEEGRNVMAFIDKNNQLVGKSYRWVWRFREDRAVVREDNFRYGFIDGKGNEVIPCQFDWAWSFHEGRAGVLKDGEWYYIDKDGNRTSKGYEMVEHFSDGWGGVIINKHERSFVDKTGTEMPCQEKYGSTEPFSSGLARCGYTFMDQTGNAVPFPKASWKAGSSFSEGYAVVWDAGKAAIVNEKFELLTDFVLGGFEKFPAEFPAFEEGRRQDFTVLSYSPRHQPYTIGNHRVFFEGTALMYPESDLSKRQLVFKSEFREGTFTETERPKMTLDGKTVWMDGDEAFLFSEEIKSVHRIDGGRVVLEKDGGRYAVLDWGGTVEKLKNRTG